MKLSYNRIYLHDSTFLLHNELLSRALNKLYTQTDSVQHSSVLYMAQMIYIYIYISLTLVSVEQT